MMATHATRPEIKAHQKRRREDMRASRLSLVGGLAIIAIVITVALILPLVLLAWPYDQP